MTLSTYGISQQRHVESESDRIFEELRILGYSVLLNVVPESELQSFREKLDRVYLSQIEEMGGVDQLDKIKERNMVRCPLAYDEAFLALATHPKVLPIVRNVIGDYFILQLQNGILNDPGEKHHQSTWHRDLPYQSYTISKPLAVNALFCIDAFSSQSGGTILLPYSHREEILPSEGFVERQQVQVEAPAGAVIFMDSMVFHRAGYNSGAARRRAINNVYTTGMIRQQISLPSFLGGRYSNSPELFRLLGYDVETPTSVTQWRQRQLNKIKSRGE